MAHYAFQTVTLYAKKSGKCPACGGSVVRQKLFEHTVNPFNKNSLGEVKTRDEVRADVDAERAAWTPDFRHNKPACAQY